MKATAALAAAIWLAPRLLAAATLTPVDAPSVLFAAVVAAIAVPLGRLAAEVWG